MYKFLKKVVFVVLLTADGYQVLAEEKVPAPNYDSLIPIIGWNRNSGDTASTISEWKRWWTYLRMKDPVVMNWINGLELRIYPKNEVFRSLFVRGIYDPNLVVAINSLLPTGGVFIDVGANMGYCSLLAGKSVGSEGEVFAIEPSERDYLRLTDNIALNKLENIKAYRLAISDSVKEINIYIAPEERSALNTLGTTFGSSGLEKLKTETVQAVTIDKFADDEKINKIDVLKLDIEGSELGALNGARNSIEKYRPAIILGVNKDTLKACGASVEDLDRVLKELRYKVYELVEEPFFAFREINSLSLTKNKIVFCLHESFKPPVLPQAKKQTWSDKVADFFTR